MLTAEIAMKQQIELSTFNNKLGKCSFQNREKLLKGILVKAKTPETITVSRVIFQTSSFSTVPLNKNQVEEMGGGKGESKKQRLIFQT